MQELIPSVKPEYVNYGHYDDIETIIMSKKFYPVFITGDTGNGKSEMVEQACAQSKRELYRINLNSMSDEDQLIGTKTLKDGNIEIVYGAVLKAMMNGAILLLDEVTASNANTILCLQPILEGKPYYFKLNNEMIYPKEGFNVFATDNTKGKGSGSGRFVGTNVMNEAFLERFGATFEQQYPSKYIEGLILEKAAKSYGINIDPQFQGFIDDLSKWSEAIRKTRDDGGDIEDIITTRRLLMIIKSYSIFDDIEKSVSLCLNRFDGETKDAFTKLWDMINRIGTTKAQIVKAHSVENDVDIITTMNASFVGWIPQHTPNKNGVVFPSPINSVASTKIDGNFNVTGQSMGYWNDELKGDWVYISKKELKKNENKN